MSPIYKFKKEKNYITLKEAAALSGYSSDYVGQLIRNGKIRGKRIYANPVWMTTEHDILSYLELNRSDGLSGNGSGRSIYNHFRSLGTKLRSELEIVKLYKGVLYLAITSSLIFSLFVFYVFSVNFDTWLSQRSAQEIKTIPVEIPIVNESVINF